MGWNFRKSVSLGPFRVNLSKGGVGWSVGIPGYRTGVNAKGKTYRQVSIPGTGIYSRSYRQNEPKPEPQEISASPPRPGSRVFFYWTYFISLILLSFGLTKSFQRPTFAWSLVAVSALLAQAVARLLTLAHAKNRVSNGS